MENRNEKLLKAWLRLSIGVNNDKLVSDLPFNESLICHLLYQNEQTHPDRPLTATDLCRRTRMLKSQMNRTLNCMERKGLIVRERSEKDKRQVWIRLDTAQTSVYEAQHQKILGIIDAIIDKIGTKDADDAIRICNLVADTAMEVLK